MFSDVIMVDAVASASGVDVCAYFVICGLLGVLLYLLRLMVKDIKDKRMAELIDAYDDEDLFRQTWMLNQASRNISKWFDDYSSALRNGDFNLMSHSEREALEVEHYTDIIYAVYKKILLYYTNGWITLEDMIRYEIPSHYRIEEFMEAYLVIDKAKFPLYASEGEVYTPPKLFNELSTLSNKLEIAFYQKKNKNL